MFIPRKKLNYKKDVFITNDQELYAFLKVNECLPISEFKEEYYYIKNEKLKKLLKEYKITGVEDG